MTAPAYRRNRVGVWTARPQPPGGSFSVEKGNYNIVLTRVEAQRLLEALRRALAATRTGNRIDKLMAAARPKKARG